MRYFSMIQRQKKIPSRIIGTAKKLLLKSHYLIRVTFSQYRINHHRSHRKMPFQIHFLEREFIFLATIFSNWQRITIY